MEVIARLKFVTPCLGAERGGPGNTDRMLRGHNGRIVFMQSWWRTMLSTAAQALNRYVDQVEQIQIDPEVQGETGVYRRWWGNGCWKEHEAFLPGMEIEVCFLLPARPALNEFRVLLEKAGRYFGISPYGWRENFGRFDVISLRPKVEEGAQGHDNGDVAGDRTDAGPGPRPCDGSAGRLPAGDPARK
jgi:hypothetical protein